MRLLRPPYDISSAVLKIVDTTWRGLLVILLLPLFMLLSILIVLSSVMRSLHGSKMK